jgi:hypothetical protein
MERCEVDNRFAMLSDGHRDQIYREIFKVQKIKRSRWEERNKSDIEDHIDVFLDDKITVQEKVLRHINIKYNTYTIEFKQNRFKDLDGEYFHIKAKYYLHGYANPDGKTYNKYCILHVDKTLDFLKYNFGWRIIADKNSNANFLAIEYNKLPDDVFFVKHNI